MTEEAQPVAVEVAPEDALRLEREQRIEAIRRAFDNPENRDRALAELHVMMTDLYNIFAQMYSSFSTNGGGLGAILKMMRG